MNVYTLSFINASEIFDALGFSLGESLDFVLMYTAGDDNTEFNLIHKGNFFDRLIDWASNQENSEKMLSTVVRVRDMHPDAWYVNLED
jgi:signal recognition particle GTPase